MKPLSSLSLEKVEFVLLSLEGPDPYSMVGGLGVRVTELSHHLASLGFRTRLYFVGDPQKPFYEEHLDGLLSYNRWCQWISTHHPSGVYHGEEVKVSDFSQSLPATLEETVVVPNAARGVTTVILGEDWQTARAVTAVAQSAFRQGLQKRCLICWNANSIFGFERIDWQALRQGCAITTVSRYMKHRMWDVGVNPLVIPNGIPRRWLDPPDQELIRKIREVFPGLLLAKIGRYHPDKRWLMALDAVGEMKRLGMAPKLIVRGADEPYRLPIMQRAWEQGLIWSEVSVDAPTPDNLLRELASHREADVIELDFFVPEPFLKALYGSADAVLANSGHEPFGLVGLEVMATGGIVFVGSTGEDYAQSFVNCVVIDSEDAREIVIYVKSILADAEAVGNLRARAQLTASSFLWEIVTEELFRKIQFVAAIRGVELN
ncbi:MAG: glycosyltransferase [Candidatus Eremiobacterota bacterium]